MRGIRKNPKALDSASYTVARSGWSLRIEQHRPRDAFRAPARRLGPLSPSPSSETTRLAVKPILVHPRCYTIDHFRLASLYQVTVRKGLRVMEDSTCSIRECTCSHTHCIRHDIIQVNIHLLVKGSTKFRPGDQERDPSKCMNNSALV